MNVLQNHQKLVSIVESYAIIYKDDIANSLLQKEISQVLAEAHKIQKQPTSLVFLN